MDENNLLVNSSILTSLPSLYKRSWVRFRVFLITIRFYVLPLKWGGGKGKEPDQTN